MAEKEERIAIYETDKQVIEGNYGDFYNTIGRADALEKMAKAICAKKHCKDICNNCEVWMHFEDCAEAALNALLENK